MPVCILVSTPSPTSKNLGECIDTETLFLNGFSLTNFLLLISLLGNAFSAVSGKDLTKIPIKHV